MNAKWITIEERPDRTSLYIFRKKFTYLKEAERFQIEISADSRYRLYINGVFLADGPCMGGEYTQYYEEKSPINRRETCGSKFTGDGRLKLCKHDKSIRTGGCKS